MSKLAPGPTELVIFDCDGVLVDSEPITLRVIVACCADLGLSMDVETAGKLFLGGALGHRHGRGSEAARQAAPR